MLKTLAYNSKKSITAVIGFMLLAPGANILKLFYCAIGFKLSKAYPPSTIFAGDGSGQSYKTVYSHN